MTALLGGELTNVSIVWMNHHLFDHPRVGLRPCHFLGFPDSVEDFVRFRAQSTHARICGHSHRQTSYLVHTMTATASRPCAEVRPPIFVLTKLHWAFAVRTVKYCLWHYPVILRIAATRSVKV